MADIEISVAPREAFKIGSFTVTETMLSAVVTAALLILFAAVIRVFFIPRWRKEHKKKSGFRILIEWTVNLFDGNAKEQTHRYKSFTGTFYFAFGAFIFIGTLIEMFNLRPPTSDLSLTLAFGIVTFLMIFVLGFLEHKSKRLLHYANPFSLLSDVVVPVSIALRMFGSVFSGYLIMHLIYSIPSITPILIAPLGNVLFTIFHAVIQSYVYMFLSMCLINEAIE